MPSLSTANALDFALDLALEADAIAMGYFGGQAETREKPDGTLVTRADTDVEAMLRRRIGEAFPDHTVLGEEGPDSPGAEGAPRWLLDPIDGTHNFARGIPVWATLIAFERDGVLEVGVASAPSLGWRWWAGRGLGAYRGRPDAGRTDGERIHVSERASVAEAQVLFGSYRHTLGAWGGRAESLLRASWRARGFGDFWGHCLVAEGAAEVMLEGAIEPYDIAALAPIVEEAGGHLTDIDGNATIDAGHCITTNHALHDEVLRLLRG